ncbi:MAG: hypothetical protein O7A63_09790 [Acidobacteria bacterium]|nr:hypothetical protein [Acidobacteriota bacterium]
MKRSGIAVRTMRGSGSPPIDALALIRLVDDPDLRARLGVGARRRALERHTWAAHVEGIIDALKRREIMRWK